MAEEIMEERRIMLKRRVICISTVLIIGLMMPPNVQAQNMPDKEIVRELRELKHRISRLEEELNKKTHEIERLKAETTGQLGHSTAIEETEPEGDFLTEIEDHIRINGLIELGGVWASVDYEAGTGESHSDLNLTTAELTLEAQVNEWVHVTTTFLYEDATFGDETSIDLDVGTITIGNTEKYPLYFIGGAMYVPFGALLTHFPDDPLIDQLGAAKPRSNAGQDGQRDNQQLKKQQ